MSREWGWKCYSNVVPSKEGKVHNNARNGNKGSPHSRSDLHRVATMSGFFFLPGKIEYANYEAVRFVLDCPATVSADPGFMRLSEVILICRLQIPQRHTYSDTAATCPVIA